MTGDAMLRLGSCKETVISVKENEHDESWIRGTSGSDSEKDLEKQDLEIPDGIPVSKFATNTPGLEFSVIEIDNPNLVQWDGLKDPKNPQNWKKSKKWLAITLGIFLLYLFSRTKSLIYPVSAFTFIAPVSSSILAPTLPAIGKELNIQSTSVENLCLSIFVLGFAFGPLVLAPLSEMYGRAKILQLSNLLYIIFNLACGFAKTQEQLIIFRLIAGLGGSAPLSLGSGVIADLFTADERGVAIGIYSFFPVLGPAIGPVCGSFIAQYSTWRWAFWAPTIADAPILLLGAFYLEETYEPVLLMQKKLKLIKETGNENLFTAYDKPGRTIAMEMKDALIRPMIMMCTQVIIIVMGLYMAYLYGIMYIVLTTFPKLWTERYHESP